MLAATAGARLASRSWLPRAAPAAGAARGLTDVAGARVVGQRGLGDVAAAAPEPQDGFSGPETTFEDVSTAGFRLRGGVVRTSCARSSSLSSLVGADVFLKAEHTQYTGSFKERGALNALSLLSDAERQRGVIAASAGNHAQALAYHAARQGTPCTVVMPDVAPLTKVQNCRRLGANVVIEGAHIGESKEFAMGLVEEQGLRYINGYDDPEIVAGAGTVGVEMLEQVEGLDAVVVPVGGAGLIAGVALAIKTLRPDVLVYGVEPESCASFSAALAAGRPVTADVRPTLADGLAVPMVGAHAFHVARRFVDGVVTVNEKSVALAVLRLVEAEKVIVEGGGAAGLAALLPGEGPLHEQLRGKRVCVPLCGGNIDTPVLGRVIDRGLAADGRLVRLSCTVSDRPGGIAGLTALIARCGVSIKDVHHERAWEMSSISAVNVRIVAETAGHDHAKELRETLAEAGYRVSEW